MSAAPPLIVLGVRRSGTTLLRVMLDRNSQLAVPDESYFVPQLARRHRDRPDPDAFVDDVRRLPTIREWELDAGALRSRLRQGMSLGEMVAAIFQTYADARGKRRWGDKTPMYMQHLPLLERLFPDARYVHLIRDGRDTAQSFLSMPRGIVTESWNHPRSVADFACQWRTEVEDAQALGVRVGRRYREVRYEALVADPEAALREVCAFADLEYEPAMLDYAGNVDVSAKPHQQSLTKAPTAGLRDWRSTMADADVLAFEEVAAPLLDRLGYDVVHGRLARATPARARARLAAYRLLGAGWRASAAVLQRSPLWKRRHPPLV